MADEIDKVAGIDPDQIYRASEGPKYFGLKRTALDDAIKRGEIEPPMWLTDSGRARGWLGSVIIKHHQKRLAASAAKASGSGLTKQEI